MQLQFSSYGLIIGIAIICSFFLIERQILKFEKIKKNVNLSSIFYKIGLIVFIFGVIGARVWHVLTDFVLYKNDLTKAVYIWNGGLSIIGAVFGGLFGIFISGYIFGELKKKSIDQKRKLFLLLLDFTVFGLPVGQALGRWGNYMNQELYGLPYSGFFKIFIDAKNRLPGFEKTAYYHPLFLYEMVATGLFAIGLHFAYSHKSLEKKLPQIGSGMVFVVYIFYYCIIRFILDFLRIERGELYFGFFGINQVVLGAIVLLILVYFLSVNFSIIRKYATKK